MAKGIGSFEKDTLTIMKIKAFSSNYSLLDHAFQVERMIGSKSHKTMISSKLQLRGRKTPMSEDHVG
ncbi:Hypothetical protein FKW44_007283 [Caligus rogercresseyi]|uniref:Uncharacterized protein n=1 Tax=Caligus rogercresseyi TaxID=217165 RepID=A0A7T8KEI0_CALRO|nr:Hypothetical protein FKW44_007283 [Caligus rogercresseyi]